MDIIAKSIMPELAYNEFERIFLQWIKESKLYYSLLEIRLSNIPSKFWSRLSRLSGRYIDIKYVSDEIDDDSSHSYVEMPDYQRFLINLLCIYHENDKKETYRGILKEHLRFTLPSFGCYPNRVKKLISNPGDPNDLLEQLRIYMKTYSLSPLIDKTIHNKICFTKELIRCIRAYEYPLGEPLRVDQVRLELPFLCYLYPNMVEIAYSKPFSETEPEFNVEAEYSISKKYSRVKPKFDNARSHEMALVQSADQIKTKMVEINDVNSAPTLCISEKSHDVKGFDFYGLKVYGEMMVLI